MDVTDEQQQPWLPFEFITEEKLKDAERQKQYREDKKQKDIEAMVNALPYFQNPVNDHQMLFNYQYEYKHGNQKALGQMYILTIKVCKQIISNFAKRYKEVRRISQVDREIKATDAASYFIEQYIKRPDFMRHISILSYLYTRVAKEIWYHRKVDDLVFFVDIQSFFKEDEDYGNPADWNSDNY